MNPSTVVLESQLDWLTLEVHTTDAMRHLGHDAARWASNEFLGGSKVRPFRLNGYVGWMAGRVRYGARDGAGLIQLSGDLAERHFASLYPRRDNISRLDLAVTVRTAERDHDLGSRHYAESQAFYREHPRSARACCFQNVDGGWTTYLGDRTSDYYLRVYDKEAECKSEKDPDGARHYANAWRYELECKGVTAPSVAKSIYQATDRAQHVQAFLHEYLTKHGLSPSFEHVGGQALVPGFRRRSDRETRLLWLERSVRPALKWLLETGDRTEVLERLGLIDLPGDNPVKLGHAG